MSGSYSTSASGVDPFFAPSQSEYASNTFEEGVPRYAYGKKMSSYGIAMLKVRAKEDAKYDTTIIYGSNLGVADLKAFEKLTITYPKNTALGQVMIDRVISAAKTLELYCNGRFGMGMSSEAHAKNTKAMYWEIMALRNLSISFEISGVDANGQPRNIPSCNF